jgi:hypothetical protein
MTNKEIDEYILKCPYFSGKNTIDRSALGTHIGSCDLEFHYRKICPSVECLCAVRMYGVGEVKKNDL